jgi:hypothetical protein
MEWDCEERGVVGLRAGALLDHVPRALRVGSYFSLFIAFGLDLCERFTKDLRFTFILRFFAFFSIV